jgi:hypothetical protein
MMQLDDLSNLSITDEKNISLGHHKVHLNRIEIIKIVEANGIVKISNLIDSSSIAPTLDLI